MNLLSTLLVLGTPAQALVGWHVRHYSPLDTSLSMVKRNTKETTFLRSELYPLQESNGVSRKSEDEEPIIRSNAGSDFESFLELFLPMTAPVAAFLTYEHVAEAFSAISDFLSATSWYPVDGGALQAQVIAPATNGVVVPAIALLYATLTSTTISTLRQRQVDIRRAINIEAAELKNLCQLIQNYPPGKHRDRCRAYLLKYTKRVLLECQPHVSKGEDVVDPRRGMETELNDISLQLYKGYQEPIGAVLASESLTAVARLRDQRIQRITALQSTYPFLHYGTLAILAAAVCVTFLIETNQDLLFFLNAFQLKLLWSILIGTFTACFTVFFDLRTPFSGSYQISASVDQLHSIRRSLAVNVFDE